MENVGRVKKEFAEQFAIASDSALAAQAAVKANAPPAPPGSGDASPGAVGGADTAVQNNYAYPNPKSCVAKWYVFFYSRTGNQLLTMFSFFCLTGVSEGGSTPRRSTQSTALDSTFTDRRVR